MTIQPNRDSFTVHCDSCEEKLEIKSGKAIDVHRKLQVKRWLLYKDKAGKWSHKCVACQEG